MVRGLALRRMGRHALTRWPPPRRGCRVGNCVGERNHGIFWWYLLFEFTLNLWTAIFAIAEFTGGNASDFKQALVPAVMVCPLFSVLILSLLWTHSAFAIFNRTTWETLSRSRIDYLRNLPSGSSSPFDHGVPFNVAIFCCGCARTTPVEWEELYDGSCQRHQLPIADALPMLQAPDQWADTSEEMSRTNTPERFVSTTAADAGPGRCSGCWRVWYPCHRCSAGRAARLE